MAEVRAALEDLYDFLSNVNTFLTGNGWDRLEETLSAATLSGVISEMVVQSLSKHSATIIKNQWHNGRPDLVRRGMYPWDAVLSGQEGVEVKASRNQSGWQGHNVESGWLMIFQYRVIQNKTSVEETEPTTFERFSLRSCLKKIGASAVGEPVREEPQLPRL